MTKRRSVWIEEVDGIHDFDASGLTGYAFDHPCDDRTEFRQVLPDDRRQEQALLEIASKVNGPTEAFVPLLQPAAILKRLCRQAAFEAQKTGREPWCFISEWTGHGSGVSSAIYELYRDKERSNAQA